MTDKVKIKAFRTVLKYLNQGKKTFSFNDMDSISDDSFSESALAAVLRKMVEDKILARRGTRQYDIIADIGAFRNYILRQAAEENEIVGSTKRAVPIDIILNSSWEAVGKGESGEHIPEFVRKLREAFNSDRESEWEFVEDEEDEEDENDGDEDKTVKWNIAADDFYADEELYINALKYCVERGIASVALIQMHFPIGYIRSCKIIEWMEENNFIPRRSGPEPRKVLIGRNDFKRIFGLSFDEMGNDPEMAAEDSALGSYLKKRANEADMRNAAQNLAIALSRLAEKKSAPITCGSIPDCSLWNYDEFEKAVIERLERIIRSDRRMGRRGAIKKAETYLEAVRDTHDRKMVQVYERIVYEFKTASNYIYNLLRNQLFD